MVNEEIYPYPMQKLIENRVNDVSDPDYQHYPAASNIVSLYVLTSLGQRACPRLRPHSKGKRLIDTFYHSHNQGTSEYIDNTIHFNYIIINIL